jgi:hypothetical protein
VIFIGLASWWEKGDGEFYYPVEGGVVRRGDRYFLIVRLDFDTYALSGELEIPVTEEQVGQLLSSQEQYDRAIEALPSSREQEGE